MATAIKNYKMQFQETEFPGLIIIQPDIFKDNRGYFFESYNQKNFSKGNVNYNFLQDNQARSTYGIIRGLHYQLEPHAQTKLIRALSGTILDVVVDLRKGSPTFHKVFSIELSDQNKTQLLIPRGFAHGYSVLSEVAEVFYKCDAYYHKDSEAGVLWNDATLQIDWKVPADKVVVSEKDTLHPVIDDCKNNFSFEG